jgi:GTP:adenosylcobinamide-phosphate guanylyltransferase
MDKKNLSSRKLKEAYIEDMAWCIGKVGTPLALLNEFLPLNRSEMASMLILFAHLMRSMYLKMYL